LRRDHRAHFGLRAAPAPIAVAQARKTA
jgi:hypothetical protein